jgi:hypothetical protein
MLPDARWTLNFGKAPPMRWWPFALIFLMLLSVTLVPFNSPWHDPLFLSCRIAFVLVMIWSAWETWVSTRNPWAAALPLFWVIFFPLMELRTPWINGSDLGLLALVPMGFCAWRAHLINRTRLQWANSGNCVACGYDLRASRKQCPECAYPIGDKIRCTKCSTVAYAFLIDCPTCESPLRGEPVVDDRAPSAMQWQHDH